MLIIRITARRVTRMRKCSSFGLHQVQVALSSGMQILIPERMLDEDRGHGMEIVERPTRSITALFFAARTAG